MQEQVLKSIITFHLSYHTRNPKEKQNHWKAQKDTYNSWAKKWLPVYLLRAKAPKITRAKKTVAGHSFIMEYGNGRDIHNWFELTTMDNKWYSESQTT